MAWRFGGSRHPFERGITVDYKNLEVSSEFLRVAGLRFDEIAGDRVRGSIELDESHHTPWGVVHGGVYTAAVESAASVGASAAVEERGQFAVGVNNSTDFLRPIAEGRVEVVAEPIMQGRSQQLWQVVITRGEDGKEVARGQVRLQNVPLPSKRPWANVTARGRRTAISAEDLPGSYPRTIPRLQTRSWRPDKRSSRGHADQVPAARSLRAGAAR